MGAKNCLTVDFTSWNSNNTTWVQIISKKQSSVTREAFKAFLVTLRTLPEISRTKVGSYQKSVSLTTVRPHPRNWMEKMGEMFSITNVIRMENGWWFNLVETNWKSTAYLSPILNWGSSQILIFSLNVWQYYPSVYLHSMQRTSLTLHTSTAYK